MDLDSNTKECTLVLTWAESLHTNRGAMETTGRRRGWGGGVGERWLTTSIPLQIVLKCTYRCRRLQNHPTMQTPFFISSRQEVSVQSIDKPTHTHMQTKKRWEPCHLSSEFIWLPFFLPALYSSMHCPCIWWQPPLLLKARVTAGAERGLREGFVKATVVYCFFAFTAPLFFPLSLSLPSGLCPGGGKKLQESVE